MLIRLMKASDYKQAVTLWESSSGLGLTAADDSQEGFERYLRRNPETWFTAESEGRLIGTVLAGHDGRRGYIYHLAVAEAYRRHGLGQELVRHAVDALRDQGIHRAALVALADNGPGNAFWDSMGFFCRQNANYREYELDQ